MNQIYFLNRKQNWLLSIPTYLSIFITLFLSMSLSEVKSQNSYSLQFSDTSTYDNSCGVVKPSQWAVRSDSCILYTPYFRKETAGCMDVIYQFKINQSGNGDVDDHVYIQYQLNLGVWITDTILNASDYAAVHVLTGTVNICYGDLIRVRVILVTNSNSEFWSIKNGDGTLTGSFETYPNVPPSISLPVELTTYKISCSGSTSLINWTTASEINNDFFTIEKSTDTKNWNILTTVPGAVNSNTEKLYYVEDKLNDNNNASYYRLKQTDLNGSYKYFEILSSKCNIKKDFILNELLVNDQKISFSLDTYDSGIFTVEIFDINGRVIVNKNFTPSEGNSNYFTIESGNLKSGIFMISIVQNENRIAKKIVMK
ncbi:MAG: T9SS type A sorting domain-containing protein [Bacteroidia bacterium]|nr:T9SS type A sorting domain-containing protein [Bacteroidia bacterium]